ncbi:MAG: DoxX family protein [Candidatus Dormibacteria bacterium]
MSFGLLLLRLIIGLGLAGHGAQKSFGWWGGSGWKGALAMAQNNGFRPAPVFAGLLVAGELLAGLGIAVGFLTPFACIGAVLTMAMAIRIAHWRWAFFAKGGGVENPLLYALSSLSLVFTGPGSWSLDHAIHLEYSTAVVVVVSAVLVVVTLGGWLFRQRNTATVPAASH